MTKKIWALSPLYCKQLQIGVKLDIVGFGQVARNEGNQSLLHSHNDTILFKFNALATQFVVQQLCVMRCAVL